jgi:heterotetrameric sarcosine oxidase gamma subunit
VPSLIEKSACDGLLPRVSGGTTLSELPFMRMTSVAVLAGKSRALGAALKDIGLDWPGAGQSRTSGPAMILWTGRDQAFLIGPDPAPLAGLAALTDQSDAWARMRLKGPGAEAVLARLVPLDLRLAVFAEGQVARSGLNHMMAIVRRAGADSFDIMVFRSMAQSAVDELHQAMEAVAARATLS